VFDRIMAAVSEAYDGGVQMIDTTSARPSACSQLKKSHTDRCMGRSHGGLTIHALVDGRGLPLQLTLTPGQAGDCPEAAQLLRRRRPGTILLADKAYDADWLRRAIEVQGAALNRLNAPSTLESLLLQETGSGTQSRRTLFKPHQAFQAHRHTLRKACRKLPRGAQTRGHQNLDTRL
jgi:transposase